MRNYIREKSMNDVQKYRGENMINKEGNEEHDERKKICGVEETEQKKIKDEKWSTWEINEWCKQI